MKELLLELHRYNIWANGRVANALSQMSEQTPERTLVLFSHILNAQTIWYARLTYQIPPYKVFQVHDVQTCLDIAETSSAQLLIWLDQLPEDHLDTIYTYTNTKGKTFTNTVQQITTHIVNHSTYHRAQIATDMRQHGFEPVVTDYIAYARELNGEL